VWLVGNVGLFSVLASVMAAALVPDLGGWGTAAVVTGLLVGTAVSVVGGRMSAKAFRRARPSEDRVWSDDTDLWWVRHRPRVPGAEPGRVARRDIVEVGLTGDDGAVVVRTVDGTEYTVTGLGTPTDRIALVAALGERVAPETARITPAAPLELPRRWRSRTGETSTGEKGTVIWRRPTRLRPLVVGAIAVSAFKLMVLASEAPKEWESAALLPAFAANCVVFMVVFREFALPGRGWLVGNGRL
jgi:hypothetical protein